MSKNYQSFIKDAKKALTAADERTLEAIGVFVEGEAIIRTPVDTGNLRNSLTHKVNLDERSVSIGTPVEYAAYVEKGTSKQKEQPYLTPAVEDNINKIKKLASEMMKVG
jgi:HK97 gp10 family phage protein